MGLLEGRVRLEARVKGESGVGGPGGFEGLGGDANRGLGMGGRPGALDKGGLGEGRAIGANGMG